MIFQEASDSIKKWRKKVGNEITHEKLLEGMGAAAVVGIVVGILMIHKSVMKIREELKTKNANAAITIEVRDFDKISIARVE